MRIAASLTATLLSATSLFAAVQIVQTVRSNGAPVWWLMAKDEGHGFAKRSNQDFQFLAMTMFWQQFLLQ